MPLEEAGALVLFCLEREDERLYLVDAPDTLDINNAVLGSLPPHAAARIERWKGSLGELIQFLKTLDRFYAMDSGPAHVAAALGIDTVVFFGPHLSHAVRPRGRHVTVVERRDVPCRPCDQVHCTNVRHQDCLTQMVRILRNEHLNRATPPPLSQLP
jgi:ADP-heptose:LPS heptosyltransferase